MSTYVYMRFLESAPARYDAGIRLISLGRIDRAWQATADAAVGGEQAAHVLDIGCGTGNLTRALADRGAMVSGIDQSAEMLALARTKLGPYGERVQLREMAAVEIADRFPAGGFDAVASSLAFSEMSEAEQDCVLRGAFAVLRPGGRLAVLDEIAPAGRLARLWRTLLRLPAVIATLVMAGATTSPMRRATERVRAAGFEAVEERALAGTGLGLLVARKPEPGPASSRGES
jgi:ubiquinone/menaquinone biosynthesis C-methylase UbiE